MCLSHSGHVTSMNHSAHVMFGFATPGTKEDLPIPHNLQITQIVPEVDGRGDYLTHREWKDGH